MEPLSEKDILDLYETGKHRRYSLLFAVNGGAFAIVSLRAERITSAEPLAPVDLGPIAGGLTLTHLAVGMALFTILMGVDIWAFGERMRARENSLFNGVGKVVLVTICAFIAIGWILAIGYPKAQ